ncbi:hypothetical protein [Sporosarcina koreensis]|uniref:hypothetical protein n=1 Tax=Bacillales TaxID=1385 RepID=UPI000759E630|nr:hypothetical protein [Sporosarcina koreensis]
MLRIIILAMLAGSVLSISAISIFKGFDLEGALIGLISLIFLFGITSFFYTEYKKQMISS